MSRLEQTGQVVHVGETEFFGANQFAKRTVVIEYAAGKDGQYTNHLAACMVKDNCDKLDAVNVGDTATLKCDVRSREYNDRWYTDVTCWAISVDAGQSEPPPPFDDSLDMAAAPF